MPSEMTDAEFLTYVEIHSRTERALFSSDQLRRLYRMAYGDDGRLPDWMRGWYRFPHWLADEVVRHARERLTG